MLYHDSILQESNVDCPVISESLALMKKNEFSDNETADFIEKTVRVLDNCSKHLGVGTRFHYTLDKHIGRIRLRIVLHGPSFNPLSDEDDGIDSISEYVKQLFLSDESAFITYKRLQSRIIITLYSAVKPQKMPSIKKPLSWAKQPMFWAIVLGVICGLVCRRLPDNIRSFLVDGLADPISSVLLALIAGVTGPVIFLSLITSISSLGSISKLTDLGFKIM